MGVIKCNTKAAMEAIGEARNLNTQSEMPESRFSSSDEIVVDLLKLNAKKKQNSMIAPAFRDICSLVIFLKFPNCTRLRLVQF